MNAVAQWPEIEASAQRRVLVDPAAGYERLQVFVDTDEEPTGTPARADLSAGHDRALSAPDGVDWAWRVYPAVREHRFVEMEYTFRSSVGSSAGGHSRPHAGSGIPQ